MRSTVAAPKRRLKNDPMDSSSCDRRAGTSGSSAMRRRAGQGRPGQQVVARECLPRERQSKAGRGGQPVKLVATKHERAARGPHVEHLIGEAKLANQFKAGRFLREDGVRPRLDGKALNAIGVDQSAGSRRCLEDERPQPAPLRLVRGGQARNAGADDDQIVGHENRDTHTFPRSRDEL
jgi:hypothetical protein